MPLYKPDICNQGVQGKLTTARTVKMFIFIRFFDL